MHVLVTGAGGFSGVEIVKMLLAQGQRVTAVYGSSPGRLSTLPEKTPRLDIIGGDLAGEVPLPQKCDAVVHAAARSPLPGVTDEQIVHDNVVATERLVAHARRAGVRAFIFLSSLSVHGRIQVPVVDEATPIFEPDSYGLSKRQCEQLIARE